MRAWFYAAKEDYGRAIADYTQAIRLEPKNWRFHARRAEAYRIKGAFDLALQDYKNAFDAAPDAANLPELYNARGLVWRDKGDYERALSDFGEAILRNPNYGFPYINRGDIWFLKKDIAKALADFNKALAITPHVIAYAYRGRAWLALDDRERAFADFREALRISPNDISALEGRGEAYEQSGDRVRARADYERALSIPRDKNPPSDWPAQARAREQLEGLTLQEAKAAEEKARRVQEAKAAEETRRVQEAKAAEETRRVREAKAAEEARRVQEAKAAEETRRVQEAKAAEEARRVREAKAAEETRRVQEAKAAEEARRVQEAKAAEEARRVQEAKAAEEARRVQEAKAAEEARRVQEAKAAEEARRVQEAKAAEEARRVQEAKAAEEARRVQEAKAAEEARRVQEAVAAAESAWREQEARAAVEWARRELEAKAAEEARRVQEAKAAEEARRVQEAKAAEEARRVQEAKAAEEARRVQEAKAAEEARRVQEAKAAEEARRVQEAKAAEEARRVQEAKAAEEARRVQEVKAAEEARRVQEAKAAEEARRVQEAKAAEEADGACRKPKLRKKQRRVQEAKAAEEKARRDQELKRVALVIGNANYALAPLDTPKNDADDITAALQRLHFDVAERKDLTVRGFDQAIDTFEAKAKDADVALFFFSGHGVQIDRRGYLAPIDVSTESESSALRGLELIQDVVSRIENSAKVSVIVLDACRDTPLQDHLRRISVAKNKALLPPQGLPPVSVVGSNTLIVYATVPGESAIDGEGRNSPFVTALLRHIETPGLEIELMFKHVTADVLRATGGKQQPERLSRLQNELVLLPAMSGATVQAPLSADVQAWIAAQSTTSQAVLEEFVHRLSGSTSEGLARGRLDELKKARLAPEPSRPRRDQKVQGLRH